MGTVATVLTAITVAYFWAKLFFFLNIVSRSLSLSCASITAEEVPWDQDFIGIDLD